MLGKDVLGMDRCWGQMGAGEGWVPGKDGCCRRTGTAEGWEAAATKPGSAMGNKSLPKPHTLAAGRGDRRSGRSPAWRGPAGAGTVAQICHSAWLPRPLPAPAAASRALVRRLAHCPLIRHDSSIRDEMPAKSFSV